MKCPFCAEEVKSDAVQCGSCQEMINDENKSGSKPLVMLHQLDANFRAKMLIYFVVSFVVYIVLTLTIKSDYANLISSMMFMIGTLTVAYAVLKANNIKILRLLLIGVVSFFALIGMIFALIRLLK